MPDEHPIPGSTMVPVGPNDPQQFVGLVPIRTERVIALMSLTEGDADAPPMELVAKLSEEQLRSLGEACRNVADWLHEHTA